MYLNEYLQGRRTITELAIQANYPPYLFARYIVEALTNAGKKDLTKAMRDPVKELTLDLIDAKYQKSERKSVEHTGASTTPRLAAQVQHALGCDPMYGPLHDKERHVVGVEYEVVLEHYLKQTGTYILQAMSRSFIAPCASSNCVSLLAGIPFETEAQLRDRGTSRTPDVLLSTPLGVETPTKDGKGTEWKMICWIDSKVRLCLGELYCMVQIVVG